MVYGIIKQAMHSILLLHAIMMILNYIGNSKGYKQG